MFEQSFVDTSNQGGKGWTTAVSITGQCFLVGVAILMPLLRPEMMPRTLLSGGLQVPRPPSPPAPKLKSVKVVETRLFREVIAGRLVAPSSIPTEIKMIDDKDTPPPEMAYAGVAGGTGVPGSDGGVISSIANSVPTLAPPPPPVVEKPVEQAKMVKRVKVGGVVQEALIMRRVLPVYPQLARTARVQGTVHLVGVIATNGTIQQLQVLSGHPLLVNAAVDAVRQWIYRPTMLNGDPVEVIAPIDVHFTLSQ